MNKTCVFLFVSLVIGVSISSSYAYDVDSLRQIEAKVQRVVENVLPCTVGLGSPNGPQSGSGVIVSSDGLILTAAHVTAATGDVLEIFFADGSQARAKALGSNFARDAGFAQIIDQGEYPFVEVGRSGDLIENQWCIAIGHPGGFQPDRTAPIRLGRIISKNLRNFVRTDCTLIGGDSGGPLFDLDGKLIGIHSNIGRSLSENNHIPVDVFRENWDRLLKGDRWGRGPGSRSGNPNRPMLGIRVGETKKDGLVAFVEPGGPAEKAGMKSNDIILSIQGSKTTDTASLRKAIGKHKAGAEIEVVVLRNDEQMTLKVKLVRARDLRIAEKKDDDNQDDDDARTKVQQTHKALQETDLPSSEQLDAKLEQLVDAARSSQQSIEMTPEDLRLFGGKQKLMDRIDRLFDRKEMDKFLKGTFSKNRGNAFFKNIVKAYQPVIRPAATSVAPILRQDRQVALGTAVSNDGFYLTKSSEIKGRKIRVEVSPGEKLDATFVRDFPQYDLALIKVDAPITRVTWYVTTVDPSLGTFVAAVGKKQEPLAIGVISVQERSLARSDKPFLGVSVKAVKGGLEVASVEKNSAAGKMKLKKGDLILSLDGTKYESEIRFIRALTKKKPGDRIRLEIDRDGTYMGKIGKLGSRTNVHSRDITRGYPQGGRLSSNRSDYPNALQTDLPIQPQDCGSPLVDLDGRVLGINIARAGRIKSYAISAEVIQRLLASSEDLR